jgi:hypothetical protein
MFDDLRVQAYSPRLISRALTLAYMAQCRIPNTLPPQW